MLVIESRVDVAGLTGRDVTDFMLACTDERYRSWWPGIHLQLHTLGRAVGGVGDIVEMDEFVGRRRLRLRGVVEAVPDQWELGSHVCIEIRPERGREVEAQQMGPAPGRFRAIRR